MVSHKNDQWGIHLQNTSTAERTPSIADKYTCHVVHGSFDKREQFLAMDIVSSYSCSFFWFGFIICFETSKTVRR